MASMDALSAHVHVVFVALGDMKLSYSETQILSAAIGQSSRDAQWKPTADLTQQLFTILTKILSPR